MVITNRWQLAVGYTAFNIVIGLLLTQLEAPNAEKRTAFAAIFLIAAGTLLIISLIVQLLQRRADPLSTFSHVVSTAWLSFVLRGGPGCLNRFSASISGASAGVRPPCGLAAR